MKIKAFIRKIASYFINKDYAEITFWRKEIRNYVKWYLREIGEHYETPSPHEYEKIDVGILEHNAILTWLVCHQQKKYLQNLALTRDVFKGMKVLDVGSGPMPSATVFTGAEVYCLDPLFPDYMQAQFPFHYSSARFICGRSESIPCQNDFFDAIISINALDHVDNFMQTAKEIERVLKPNGKVRLYLHYHKKTITEPIELNDEIIQSNFMFCNIAKVSETKIENALQDDTERYVLWSNF